MPYCTRIGIQIRHNLFHLSVLPLVKLLQTKMSMRCCIMQVHCINAKCILSLGVIRRIFVLVENGLIFALPIFSRPSRFHSEFSQLRKYIWYLSLSCIPYESRCNKLIITIDKTQSCNHASLWAWTRNVLTLNILHRLEASPSNSLQCSQDLLQSSTTNVDSHLSGKW